MNFIFIYIFLGAMLLGALIWLIIIIFRERKETDDDVLWDTKFCSSITQGYTKLAQRDVKIGDSGRLLITAEVKDIDYKRAEKEHLKLPVVIKFAIPPELVESLSKGDSARDRHEKIALPRHAKDMPFKLRHTAFGSAWAEHIEKGNRLRAIEEIMTKDNQAQTKIAEMLSHDNLLLELQKTAQGFEKLISESLKDIKKPSTSDYGRITSPSGSHA